MNRAEPPRPAGIARDESGAIVVIGVFMAIVLVGVLYYLAGIGATIFHRERMQDAADAVSLATAIGHARGMNLIVFLNLVMAALVAVVLALKVIEMLLVGLTLVLTGISWFFPPAAAAIPAVNGAREVVAEVHNVARDIVDEILKVLHLSEEAVKMVTPGAAVAAAGVSVTEAYADVADVTLAIPPRLTLPVEADVYDRLCREAEEMLGRLVRQATSKVPLIGEVIGGVLDRVIGGVSAAYCYRNGTPPRGIDVEFDRTLPTNQDGLQCEEDRAKMDPLSSACQAFEAELDARRPEPGTFDCATNNVACKRSRAEARRECNPSRRPAKENYSWVQQRVEEVVEYDAILGGWKTKSFEYVDGTVEPFNVETSSSTGVTIPDLIPEQDAGRPCAQTFYGYRDYYNQEPTVEERARNWSDWNEDVDGVNPPHIKPVCHKRLRAELDMLPELPPDPHNPPRNYATGPHTLSYDAVRDVFACSQEETRQMEFPIEWSQGASTDDGSDKSPHKVEEGVELGDGDFQMRGFAIDPNQSKQPSLSRRKLEISAFHQDTAPEDWVSIARAVGGVALAQAEYYYNHNGTEDRDLWMWEMKWRARLVRFTLPGGDDDSERQNEEASVSASGIEIPGGAPDLDLGAAESLFPGDSPGIDVIADLIVH